MLNKVLSIITTVVLIVSIIVIVLLGGVRLIGFTPYGVTSGSMEPKYKVGSVVYVRHVEPETLKEGDVITFHISEDELATHRIIRVERTADGLQFWTKGDANSISDGSPVAAGNVVGKVYFTIPFLGVFAGFLEGVRGKVIIVLGALMLLVLIGLNDYLTKLEKET
ncbi:MAG: signal peptidase I [Mogibacterium sp.]|nr:signal peptidase I [Mogibacterium sp.]